MVTVNFMIGIPGSGKSTYAKNNLSGEYISSDKIRKEMYGDISIQGDPEKVFAVVYKKVQAALSEGKDIIFDATNINRYYRKEIMKNMRKWGAKSLIAYVMCTPVDVCITRNNVRNDRSQPVPEAVIRKMHRVLKREKRFLKREDFDAVNYVREENENGKYC